MSKHYKIVKLSASNIKRLKAVEILPSGHVVTVGGKNDQGKTSLLDSIMFALAGQDSVCERPIREGATKGEIVVDLDDMIVTKTFKSASAPTLRINLKDGTPVKSPQAILDALCSKISYNPMEWMTMKSDKQLEMLSRLVGVDLAPFKIKREKLYNERTILNRELTQKRAKLATMPEHPDAPQTEVSVAELMGQLKALQQTNAENEKVHDRFNSILNGLHSKRAEAKTAAAEVQRITGLLEEATKELEGINNAVAEMDKGLENAKAACEALVDEDEGPVTKQIEEADTVNSKVRDNAARMTLAAEVATLAEKEAGLTNSINVVDSEKEDA